MAAAQFFFAALRHCLLTACIVFFNLGRLVHALLRPRAALASENLFLRKQLALFQERNVKPRRTEGSTRWLNGDREPAVRLVDGAGSRQT